MVINYDKRRSPGVSTLMYIGDGPAAAAPMPSNARVGAGVVGALLALFSSHPVAKIAGAAVAGFVGFDVYQAKR